MRKPSVLSIDRVYHSLPPYRRPAAVRVDGPPRLIPRHDVLVGTARFLSNVVWLTLVSPTSDAIFLLGGVVDVVLFCVIRRVIPVKEVAKALFTGQIFRTQENSPTDSTWFIGTMEIMEDGISDDLSLPIDDDHFVFRQPKSEILTLPPPAVLPIKFVTPTASKQMARPPITISTEAVFYLDPRSPPPKVKLIPRKPSPRESVYSGDGKGRDRSSSISRQGSTRKLPPIPQGPRAAALPSVVQRQETPPPPYRPTTAHNNKSSVSRSVPSHSHSNSLDSIASDSSLISGSTLLGSTGKGSIKDDDSPS